ncbi:hypothetical protein GUITHDRAFT_144871 [Guillardia theta CCMP2712]|uniref:Phosphodiesterase n=1 Tax=Guillardia theta (strain CCMP2712) TaxID=905079 RepID=L1IMV8_GUITC|nr:hypothetical protein GUITHDRAFT_144871 [Guillardia theta CCMP2712]EKX37593.1 hypothetical protein GUITHDRAFT_144871 [Guillardia theta CCMP2712]|eukprot:XP_005824573.1 hypothetical protein GUITHDRAFT_144871 [Guillardia theta CCMP2712]
MELVRDAIRRLRLGFLQTLFIKWFGLVSYSGDENGKEVGNSPEEPTENSILKENLADLRAENAKLKLKVDKLARIVTMRRMSENDSQTVNQDQLLALARNAMAREREDATLHKLVDTIVQSAYHLLMPRRITALQAQRISVFVQDDVNQELWLAASDDAVGLRIPNNKGVAGMVARTMQPINIPDCQQSSLFDPAADQMTGFVTKTMICVPITWNGYYLIGVFQALNKQDNVRRRGNRQRAREGEGGRTRDGGLGGPGRGQEGVQAGLAALRVGEQEGNIIPFTEYDMDMLNILSKVAATRSYLLRTSGILPVGGRQTPGLLLAEFLPVSFPCGHAPGILYRDGEENRRRSTVFCVPEGFQLTQTGALASELSWDFNVWDRTEDQLVVYAVDIYKSSGLSDHFNIKDDVLLHFILDVKRQYNHCPFHNFRHAFAVMQTLYVVLRDTAVTDYLTDIDKLALITASLCHDVDHPGVTNDLLVKTESDLALLYNDCSVLENHHCTTTFKILRRPQSNILASLDKEDFAQARRALREDEDDSGREEYRW